MADTTETPVETLDAATQKNALPQGKLVLVGTFDKVDGPVALIRTPKGEITTVSPGDRVGAATVTAIGMGVLYMARGNRAQVLTLPDPA